MIVYSTSQRMASQSSTAKSPAGRPGSTRTSSYSHQAGRDDDNDSLKPPQRAHTFQSGSPTPKAPATAEAPDAFDMAEETDTDDGIEVTRASVELDVLPIELISLTDSFVDSLGAKVHSTPPSIERLSQLFQDFYATASSHINTHISALASRQSRDVSPAASASSISSAASRLRSKATTLANKDKLKTDPEQQMITSEELADRKRARKALEGRRGLLEEAVERRLCEGIYDRIYRHKSTQDEAQDDKLRSKTAALALVGIGPADLGIELGDRSADVTADAPTDGPQEIRESLDKARKDLARMAESKYPLGKINHLKAAHRSIVDTLAQFHPSASADEIMPTLIYTLITLSPENLHIISDIHFIQNFRWEPKLTGEAAYCLTNVEAAISFLQTVDLATLRANEQLSGPPKSSSQPGTPKTETFPPAYPQGLTVPSASTAEASTGSATHTKPAGSPAGLKAANVLRNRRLSDLVNTPAQAFGAASDAVFSTADQGLKTISTSLGDSYKFLVGKVRERQDGPKESIDLPRTLDDARKLVSTPPPDDDESLGGAGPDDALPDGNRLSLPREDRVLSAIGGRRDHSADSTRSGRSASSAKKVLFADDSRKAGGAAAAAQPGQNNPDMLEQVRNLGNTFNPMARLSSIGNFRGFGRNAPPPSGQAKDAATKTADGGDLAAAFPDIATSLPTKEAPRLAPPNKRFMEMQSPGDLKLGEVLDLLRDYRRLAGALESMGAFEKK